jgi:hypothetical protein
MLSIVVIVSEEIATTILRVDVGVSGFLRNVGSHGVITHKDIIGCYVHSTALCLLLLLLSVKSVYYDEPYQYYFALGFATKCTGAICLIFLLILPIVT